MINKFLLTLLLAFASVTGKDQVIWGGSTGDDFLIGKTVQFTDGQFLKKKGSGTGLGLSLRYDIVKEHGGELKVETKEGEGSEFSIQIPINTTNR